MRSIPPVPDVGREEGRRARVLSQNLLALGMTSFFTDISSEMVVAIVPLFLTTSLGFSIIGFGLYEVAYQGTNAAFRIWGGSIADHRQRHKQTAAIGYTISAATRFGLVLSSLVAAIPAVPFLLADRVGKGLRTAPRDALISLSTAPSRLAMAFGVHRAMDTAGALIGPLLAYWVLSQAPGAFDAVFVLSAVFGVVGVAVIWLFAQEKSHAPVVREPRRRVLVQWREVLAAAGVARLAIAVSFMSLFTVGDAFVYLVILRTADPGDFYPSYFPLLFVGTALVYLLLAVPCGRLADRIGTRPVFLAGNALLILLYLLLGYTGLSLPTVLCCLALLGAYYAATDGVVPAMVSRLVGEHVRASGIAFITVLMAVARMGSAAVFGTLWQTQGRTTALTVFTVAMSVALVVAAVTLATPDRTPSGAASDD